MAKIISLTPRLAEVSRTLAETISKATESVGASPIAIWVPNYEWLRQRLDMISIDPPVTLSGLPVRMLPGGVDDALRRSGNYDRYWLELPEDFWWEGILPIGLS